MCEEQEEGGRREERGTARITTMVVVRPGEVWRMWGGEEVVARGGGGCERCRGDGLLFTYRTLHSAPQPLNTRHNYALAIIFYPTAYFVSFIKFTLII